jgi:YVTN family beta-propeller protein
LDNLGTFISGGPIVASNTLQNGNILLTFDASSGIGVVSITSGLNAGNITLAAGGNITTSTILGGANVTMTSGGSVPSDGNLQAGINLTGYGILSPFSNVTLTTTGTGDIRGQTRLVTTLPTSTTSTSMSVLLPNGRFVYASDGNDVDVFSTGTYSRVGPAIAVGTNPFMGVYSSSANSLYVTNSGSNNVSVIDTGTNSVVATIPVGTAPQGVAVTPNGQFVYVANNGTDTVSVIDTRTNLVVKTISLAGSGVTNATGIAINTAQNLAYVSDSAGNTIAVINTKTNALTGTTLSLPSGANNASLTFNPAGNLLYAAVGTGAAAGTYSFNTTTNTLSANVLPAGQSVNFYPQGTVGLITAGTSGTFRFDSVLGTGRFFGVNTTAGFGSPVGTVPNSFNNGEFQGVNYQAFLPLLGTNAVAAFQTASVVGGRVILASNSGNIFINTLTPTLTAFSGGDSTKGIFISQIGSVTLAPATVDVGAGPVTVNSGVGGIFQFGSSPYNGLPANINVAAGNPAAAVTATTVYLFTPTGNIGTPANPFTLSTVSGQQLSLLVTAEANVSGFGNVYLNVRGNDLSATQPALVLNEVSVGGQTPVDTTTGNFSLVATQGSIGLNAVVSAMTSASLSAATNIIQQAGGGVFSDTMSLSTTTGDIGSSGVGAIAIDCSTLSVNAGGNAFINQIGAIDLEPIVVGGTFQLASSGSASIHSIDSQRGSVFIILGPTAGTLDVVGGSGISAGNGKVVLENDNVSLGDIIVGANCVISAGSVTPTFGQVDIVMGPVPATPVVGARPANVVLTQTLGGKVFFGQLGITAQAPSNSINARGGGQVTFNTNGEARSAITLGGGVYISAIRGTPLITSLDLADSSVVSQIQSAQQSGLLGGKLVVTGGVATGGTLILVPGNLSTMLSAENIPANVTVTFQNFVSATPINVNLTNASTTTQVKVNGIERYTGAAAVTNVTSTLGGTVFNEGITGTMTGTTLLQVNTSGDAVYNGAVSAPNIVLAASPSSGGQFTLGGTIGLPSTRSLTVRADGNGAITQTAGTIRGLNISLTSGTGNATIISVGTGSTLKVNTTGNVSVTSAGALNLQSSAVGGTFTVNTAAALSVLGFIDAPNVTLNPGTLLNLSSTVGDGTGVVSITLRNASGMFQRATTANILANSVAIIAGTGALGSAAARIRMSTNTLSINSLRGSNAFINNIGTLTIDNTVSGSSLNVLSSTGLTVGNVSSIAGAVNLQAANGTLNVISGDNVVANGGNLLLQNLNTSSGTIVVGANATVKASAPTTAGGNVTIFVGTGTVPRINPVPPPNVTPVITGTGRIFYGGGSITAIPTSTLTAASRNIIFSGPGGAITLDSGVTITAIGHSQQVVEGDDLFVDTGEDADGIQEFSETLTMVH